MKFIAFFLVLAVCRAAPQGFQDETLNVDTFLRKVSTSEGADSVVESTIRKLVEGGAESSFASGGSVSQGADISSSFGSSGGLSSGGFSSGGFSSGGLSTGGFSSGGQDFSSDFSGANQGAVGQTFGFSNVGASEGFSAADAAAADAINVGSVGANVINVGVNVEDSSNAATATRFSDHVEQPVADKFVKKYFYFGLPDTRKKEPQLVKTFKQPGEVRQNVIFIKTPSTGSSRSVLLNQQGQVQEKTVVYVLVKDGEEEPALPQPQPLGLPKAHKPEVVFVKYKNNKKAGSGDFAGDSFGARFGGASNVGVVKTTSDFGGNAGFGAANTGFGSGVSGFGSGVSGFGSGVSNFGAADSGFGSGVSSFGNGGSGISSFGNGGSGISGFGAGGPGFSSGNSGFDSSSINFRSGSSGGSESSIQIIPGRAVGGQISEDRVNSELSELGGLRNLETKSSNTVSRTF